MSSVQMVSLRRRRASRRAVTLGAVAALALPTVTSGPAAHAAPVSIDLCALGGSTTLPNGASVPIWTYVTGDCVGAVAPTAPGGPTIVVNQGDVVTVTLHNTLAEASGLHFQGQAISPDTTGASAGSVATPTTKSYSFTASAPGTFLYEAGLLPNAQHQTAMGLYGALVVMPAVAGSAYGTPDSAFDQEAVVLLSEIDPALNNKAGGPATFDMRNYRAKYRLVNGRAHSASAPIAATAGQRLLLRYVNAGIDPHSLGLLGLRQKLVGNDGNGYAFPHVVVAETIGSGQTMDAIAAIPASAAAGTKYLLYDASLSLHNNNQLNTTGGMLTTIDVVAATTGPPLVSGLTASPAGFSATVTAFGGATVSAAEFFRDVAPGAPGSGTTPATSSGIGTAVATFSDTFTGLGVGTHVVHVRGQDSNLVWGPVATVTFTIGATDIAPPTTSGLTLTPNPATTTTPVSVAAAASDAVTGGSAITAAELTLDYGLPVAMLVTPTGPDTADLTATIPAGLVVGNHTVTVRSRDAAGNWSATVGATLPVTLLADTTGPVTSAVSASPNPSNGAVGYNAGTPAVRVFATITDAASNIAAAEGFIDPVGTPTNGSGFVFVPVDGTLSSTSEVMSADIPLTTVAGLSNGNHTIGVRGKDAAGNWTATLVSTTLVIDKIAPSIVSISRADVDPTGAATVQFLVTFSESVSGVTTGNFAVVSGAGLTGAAITSVTGAGATRTVTVATGFGGGGTLGLNLSSATGIVDLASNALPAVGLPFVGPVYTQLTPPLYFSTFGNTNPPGVAGTADDADIYFWNGTTAFSRSADVSGAPYGLPAAANADGFDRVSATQFYLSFAGQVNVPGIGLVEDEDVVLYNAGVWSMFFDGSARGLTGGSATDLDAISIVGGQLYFSTDNAAVPPGAGGTGDNADIYRWNGLSSFTRVVDASVVGWSTANVDGLVWVDATHVYLSYSTDTSIPVVGAVQDEDVVYFSSGTWSVYFNGTARGLTAASLDVDAFDRP